MDNLKARLTEINAEWKLRIDVLAAQLEALKMAMDSDLDSRKASIEADKIESEAIQAELDNWLTARNANTDSDDVNKNKALTTEAIDLKSRMAQLEIRIKAAIAEWHVRWSAKKAEFSALISAALHAKGMAYKAAKDIEMEAWYNK